MKINLTPSEQKIFEAFKSQFLKANDSHIEFISAKREQDYIRVELLRNGQPEWLHVTSSGQWY